MLLFTNRSYGIGTVYAGRMLVHSLVRAYVCKMRCNLIYFGLGFRTQAETFAPIRLHFAINNHSSKDVEAIIAKTSDLNFFVLGNTPLTLSIIRERFDVALALITAGAAVSLPENTKWRRQPIHFASQAASETVMRAIVDKDSAALHATDAMLFTPLHWAAIGGHTRFARHLINAGAHVNVKDDRGRTPLFRAAEHGRVDTILFLREAGGLVNCRDNFGWTPLFHNIVCQQTGIQVYFQLPG